MARKLQISMVKGDTHAGYPVAVADTSSVESHRVTDDSQAVSRRLTMASDCGPVSASPGLTPGRTAARRASAVPGGNPLGAEIRRPVARFTRTVSFAGNVLAASAGVDAVWRLGGRLGQAAGKTRGVQTTPLGRTRRRRNVFAGKKGGAGVGLTKRGKGTKIMLMVDAAGTPVSAFTASANTAEVHAVETLLDVRVVPGSPERLLYDKAADADWLREALQSRGIELICPHRTNRKRPALQDGRSLRRFWRRFVVERTISWLHWFRRLVVRYEYYDDLFEGFLRIACMYTILKWF